METLKGKHILLGLTGGIAVYKSASLLRRLTRDLGADVQVVMTEAALQFMTPLIFETFSGRPVLSRLFDENDLVSTRHIDLVQQSDLILISPATANIVAKAAGGIADDLLSTMISAAPPEKVYFALAMNRQMYENPAAVHNRTVLLERGYHIIDAEYGELATNMEGVGKGRLADEEVILSEILDCFSSSMPLRGKKILVSAGPTREFIDRVRFISNPSTGKMGIAIAEAAGELGADVTLVKGPGTASAPACVTCIDVTTAEEMRSALLSHYDGTDAVIMAAAVEDMRPVASAVEKIKKDRIPKCLELEASPDILSELSSLRKDQILVGFSLESENVMENSRKKLETKKLDHILVNSASEEGAGFAADTNRLTMLSRGGQIRELGFAPKKELAGKLLRLLISDHERLRS